LTEAKRTRELLANCKSLEEDGAGHSASVADMRKLARAFIADIEAAEPAQPKPAEPPALTSEILKTKGIIYLTPLASKPWLRLDTVRSGHDG
jgi:hypothetical protein